MATLNIQYGAQSGVPWTITSLASDTNLLAGRESAYIDNQVSGVSLYPDYLASAKITAGQSPTVNTNIELWVVAQLAATGNNVSVWPDSFAGNDANVSVKSLNTKYSALGLARVITVDAFPNRSYGVQPFSVAGLFGGICPLRFSFFLVHNTAVVLSPTGTLQGLWVTPVTNIIG